MSSLRPVRRSARSGPRRVATAVLATLGLLTAGVMAAPAALADTIVVHPTVANNVLTLLNQERAAHHLPALRMNTNLINSAYAHNQNMAVHDSMSHQLPGEKPLGDRLDAAHYKWATAGECIGWTSDNTNTGALNIQRYMYNEKAPNDGHRLIILSSAYRDIGISVITDMTHKRLWITEDFGHLM
jgi:uncharacterized protein YkwD